MFILINKDNIVIGTCGSAPCPEDLATRGEFSVESDGKIFDIYLDGVLYPKPSNSHKFDFISKSWVFDLVSAKNIKNLQLRRWESSKIMDFFPDTVLCQGVRDQANSLKTQIETANTEIQLNLVVFAP